MTQLALLLLHAIFFSRYFVALNKYKFYFIPLYCSVRFCNIRRRMTIFRFYFSFRFSISLFFACERINFLAWNKVMLVWVALCVAYVMFLFSLAYFLAMGVFRLAKFRCMQFSIAITAPRNDFNATLKPFLSLPLHRTIFSFIFIPIAILCNAQAALFPHNSIAARVQCSRSPGATMYNKHICFHGTCGVKLHR